MGWVPSKETLYHPGLSTLPSYPSILASLTGHAASQKQRLTNHELESLRQGDWRDIFSF